MADHRRAFSDFFSATELRTHLTAAAASPDEAQRMLDRTALDTRGIARLLLASDDADVREQVHAAADAKRRSFWQTQLFLMPPLYISNGNPGKGGCVDVCIYCPWRNGNVARERLLPPMTSERISQAVSRILSWGYGDVELVAATDPRLYDPRVVASAVTAAHEAGARRVGMNIFPLASPQDYAMVSEAGADFSIVWQETYEPVTYKVLHPSGRKSDYAYRLDAHDRALSGGIRTVGVAFLGGVADWRFDALATIIHARYLMDAYGANLIFGMPRWKSTEAVAPAFAREFSDADYSYVGALFSLAIPTALPWFSTREDFELSAAAAAGGGALFTLDCSTAVDGYECADGEPQFPVFTKPYREGVPWLVEKGFVPRSTLPW